MPSMRSDKNAEALPIPKSIRNARNSPELCSGFRAEMKARIQNLQARCNKLSLKHKQSQQSNSPLTRHGTTRVYLHHNRSLMWCETPKAMSTSWGRAVFGLEGRDTSKITYVRVHIWMHDTFEYLAPTILSTKAFTHVENFSSYRKLLFVRDPFTRLLSAYLDKVEFPRMKYHDLVTNIKREVHCNYSQLKENCYHLMEGSHFDNISAPLIRRLKCHYILLDNTASDIINSAGLRDQLVHLIGREIDFQKESLGVQLCNHIKTPIPVNYERLYKQCSKSALLKSCSVKLSNASVPTFEQFTKYVLDAHDPKYALDRHWSPTSLNCAPCEVPYTHILRFESMVRDVECILREVYPADAYAKLLVPSLYMIDNGTIKVTGPNVNPLANSKKHSITSLIVSEGTVGALRPRDRDYKREGSRKYLKDYYAQLSPVLMRRLWDFSRDDADLFDYDSEPDFGLEKFRRLHAVN